MRRISLLTCLTFLWLVVSPSIAAAVVEPARLPGRTRKLSLLEMRQIIGAQEYTISQQHVTSLKKAGGSAFAWEGNAGDINTGNGNKITDIPIVGWKARGGRLAVDFTLYHNSQGNRSNELGEKWTHTYNIFLVTQAADWRDEDQTDKIRIHWGNALTYDFAQNINGTYSAPTGIFDTLTSTGSGTSRVFTLTTKDQIRYTFQNLGGSTTGWHCTSIKDRNDNTITIAHNSSALVTTVTDPTSRVLTLTYGTSTLAGKLVSVTDPLSRVWTINYNTTTNDLTRIDYPAVSLSGGGSVTYDVDFAYNSAHRITTLTDKRNKNWTFAYFTDGSIAWEKNPLLQQTSYAYFSGYTTVTDPRSYVLRHNYTSGRLSSVVDQASNTESYTYSSAHLVTGKTDRRSKSWSYTYDSMGNRLTVTDPLSHTTTWTYNSKNDPLTVTTHLGHATTYAYDTPGNLTSVTDPLSHATTYTVNSNGQTTAVTDALSHATSSTYDTDGNPLVVTRPIGYTSYVHDTLGRVTSVTDPTSRVVTTTYDELGRAKSVTAPGSRTTTVTFDGEGNKLTVTNPEAEVDTYTYDDAGRPATHVNGISLTTSFGYDAAGNRTSITDGRSKVTTYSYTGRGELSGISYPDSTSEGRTYLATGELYTKTDGRGVVTTHSYDNAGKLTGKSYSDGVTSSVTIGYDNDNRKTSMVDGSGTTTYAYDNASRLTTRSAPAGSVTYAYDNANRLTSRTVAGVDITTFSYDNADRMTGVTAPGSQSTTYTYDNADRPLTTTFANGSVETRTYATSADLDSVVLRATSGGTVLSSQDYTYDSAGRRLTETLLSGSVLSFGYDNAGQLTSESRTGTGAHSTTYTYDNAGNRATKAVGGVTETYTNDDANKLTSTSTSPSSGSKSYSYDNAGNVTQVVYTPPVGSAVTTTLTWDGEGRLKTVGNGSYSDSFSYNGLGQRIGKTDSAGTFTYTLADDSIDAPVLRDGAASYIHGTGLLSETRSGTSKFYHSDAQGSTRAITSSAAAKTDTKETDAFGMVIAAASSGSTPTPFGFGGQHGYQSDNDTGLMRLGHRYYDCSTGRFISRDPIQDGYNWYTYCENDPVNAVDPEGLKDYDTVDQLLRDFRNMYYNRSIRDQKEYGAAIIKVKEEGGGFHYTLGPVTIGDDKSITPTRPPGTIGDVHTHPFKAGDPVPSKPGYVYGDQELPGPDDGLYPGDQLAAIVTPKGYLVRQKNRPDKFISK